MQIQKFVLFIMSLLVEGKGILNLGCAGCDPNWDKVFGHLSAQQMLRLEQELGQQMFAIPKDERWGRQQDSILISGHCGMPDTLTIISAMVKVMSEDRRAQELRLTELQKLASAWSNHKGREGMKAYEAAEEARLQEEADRAEFEAWKAARAAETPES